MSESQDRIVTELKDVLRLPSHATEDQLAIALTTSVLQDIPGLVASRLQLNAKQVETTILRLIDIESGMPVS